MNCNVFRAWLDDGLPEASAPAARTHAAGCASCARELAAALALSATLSEPRAVRAPAGFTDHVMQRISASRTVAPLPSPTLPWWIQAAAQPAAALALVVAALLLWRGDALLGAGRALLGWLSTALTPAAASLGGWAALPAPFASPTVQLGVGFALLPLVVAGSLPLYRWSERLFAARPLIAPGIPLPR